MPPATIRPKHPRTIARPSKNRSKPPAKGLAVALGSQLIAAWYSSFYPSKAVNNENGEGDNRLYVCEHCFRYTKDGAEASAHQKFCNLAKADEEPLGKLVYSKDSFSIYEVDGEEHTLFCQCLSLFAKLFLDTKSIYYDVDPFLFYTLIELLPPDTSPPPHRRIVGFFSKEKMSWDGNILACILVFPPYQRRGLGKVLISFSYALARIEKKLGGPEKPLSDLGQKGYKSYWTSVIASSVLSWKPNRRLFSIGQLSQETWIHQDDVLATLRAMNAICKSDGDAAGVRAGKWVVSRARIREFVESNGVNVGVGGIELDGLVLRGSEE